MAFKEDMDLIFLEHCSLDVLVNYLIYDKDGEQRILEKLTSKPLYRKYQPNHQKYWRNIAEQVQLYGANSIVSFIRGNKGVSYRKILGDVCKKMKVDFIEDDDIKVIERSLMLKMLSNSIDNMSPEELEQLVDQLHLDVANMSKETVKDAFLKGWKIGSSSLVLMASGILAKAIALRFGMASVATVGLGVAGVSSAALNVLLGPIGLAALAGVSIAGPAYRVTIPCVTQIAYMRVKKTAT